MEARMTHRRMATDRQPMIDGARIQVPSVRLSSSLLPSRWLPVASVLLALLVAGCATPMPRKDDPYETFNRKMYAFNDFVDHAAIRPAAVGYRKITNDTSRRLISNFFANIESPVTIANDLLQANAKEALKATSRLAINSTIGVLGL